MGQINAMQDAVIRHYHKTLKEVGTREAAIEQMTAEIMVDQNSPDEHMPGIAKQVRGFITRYEAQTIDRLEMSFQLRD